MSNSTYYAIIGIAWLVITALIATNVMAIHFHTLAVVVPLTFSAIYLRLSVMQR